MPHISGVDGLFHLTHRFGETDRNGVSDDSKSYVVFVKREHTPERTDILVRQTVPRVHQESDRSGVLRGVLESAKFFIHARASPLPSEHPGVELDRVGPEIPRTEHG